MTELPPFAQGQAAQIDDEFIVDAQAQLAAQLVRYSRPVGADFVRAAFWLTAYLGPDAKQFLDLAMEYKDRQSIGGRKSIVDALRAVALYEARQAQGGGLGSVLGGLLGRR